MCTGQLNKSWPASENLTLRLNPRIFKGSVLSKAWGSFVVDLFSDTHTLTLSMLILNSQFADVAKEVNDKRAGPYTTMVF